MNYAHSIPDALQDAAKADLPPVTPGRVNGEARVEPSHAERARTLVHACEQGFLSTICREPAGFPFGSVVKHSPQPDGHVFLCLSDLAEHSKNLTNDRRASLMVVESSLPGTDPLAAGRVTLIGPLQRLEGPEEQAARSQYLETYPGAYFADFADFHMYRLEVSSVRFVGGFGKMSWVKTPDYLAASPDPLRPDARRIIDHMNDDHSAALITFSRIFGSSPDTTAARMTAVDRYGFDIIATTREGDQAVRIGFGDPCSTSEQVRAKMVEMVRRARKLEGAVD